MKRFIEYDVNALVSIKGHIGHGFYEVQKALKCILILTNHFLILGVARVCLSAAGLALC